MGQIIVYSIMSGVILALLYMVYKITLASENQHAYNRMVILLIYGMALISPLLLHNVTSGGEAALVAAGIEVGRPSITFATPDTGSLNWLPEVLAWIYIAGAAVAAILTTVTALRIKNLIKGGERYDSGQISIIIYDTPMAPFSWGRFIIISRSDYEAGFQPILTHEQCHINSRHWIDLIIAQLVIILQWYNPAAWLMREELMLVHEYQADEAVIQSGADLSQYQMLLIKKAVGGRFQSLANSLNHSNLKKRITMMYTSKSSMGRRFRALALVPAAIVAVAVVANPVAASALDSMSQVFNSGKVTNNNAISAVDTPENSQEKVHEAAEVPPQYPGGESELLMTIAKNLKYPEKAQKENQQGIVVVRFVVNSKGEAGNPSIVRGVSQEIDAEAIRVISTIGKFTPATIGGKPVSVYYTVPIRFKNTK